MGIGDTAVGAHVDPRLQKREVDLQPITDLVVAAILFNHDYVEEKF